MKPIEEISKLGVLINWSIIPASSVNDTYKGMIDKRLGALLVLESGKLMGLVSDGDSFRKLILAWKRHDEVQLREIITRNIIFAPPDQIAEECLALTEKNHIRHVPVMVDGYLTGIISMENLAGTLLSEREAQ